MGEGTLCLLQNLYKGRGQISAIFTPQVQRHSKSLSAHSSHNSSLIKMTSSPRQFILPDLLSNCPLKDATNPYYKEAAAESRAWINSYDIFTDRKRAFFIQGQNELLCSHVYSFAGFEQLRTTCDFVSNLSLPKKSSANNLLRSTCCLLSTKSATSRMARMPERLVRSLLTP